MVRCFEWSSDLTTTAALEVRLLADAVVLAAEVEMAGPTTKTTTPLRFALDSEYRYSLTTNASLLQGS